MGLSLPLKYLEQLGWLPMTFNFSDKEWVKAIEARGCNFETGTSKWKKMLKEELKS